MQKLILILPFLMVTRLNAQIYYKDLKPNYVQSSSGVKNIDINQDLKPDLQFSLTILDPNSDVWFVLNTDDSVDVYIDSTQFNFVGRLNASQTIHAGLKWKTGSNIPIAYLTSGAAEGPWPGSVSKYMAYRIRNGAHHYYGWLRMSVNAKTTSFTLQEFAYETSPNTSITTDDLLTSVPVNAPRPDYVSFTTEERILHFSEPLTFEIVDLTGKSILSGISGQTQTLNLAALSSGCYLLKMTGSKGVSTKKIVLN